MSNLKITMVVMVLVVLALSGCTSKPVVTYTRPICSPAPYPKLPYLSDSEIRKMSPDSRNDLYEIYDKLVNWGTVNESIIRQVCQE